MKPPPSTSDDKTGVNDFLLNIDRDHFHEMEAFLSPGGTVRARVIISKDGEDMAANRGRLMSLLS